MDSEDCSKELEEKLSLYIYKRFKTNINAEEHLYDNTPASTIFHKARTNNMNLNARKSFQDGDTSCMMCGAVQEDLGHFLVHCPGLTHLCINTPALHQPYLWDCTHTLALCLFTHTHCNKQLTYQMWTTTDKIRCQYERLTQ